MKKRYATIFGKCRNDPTNSSRCPGRSISGVKRARSTPLGSRRRGPIEQRAVLFRHDDHAAVALDPLLFESPPAPIIPPASLVCSQTCRYNSNVTSCSTSTSPRVGREHRVFHLHSFDLEVAADASQRALHRRRTKFVHFGRQQRGPARLAIARFPNQDHAGAMLQHGREVGVRFAIAKCEQKDVELLRQFAQQVEDAYRAAVRQRIRKIRAQHRDPAPARGQRPSLDFLNAARDKPIGLSSTAPATSDAEKSGPAGRL